MLTFALDLVVHGQFSAPALPGLLPALGVALWGGEEREENENASGITHTYVPIIHA